MSPGGLHLPPAPVGVITCMVGVAEFRWLVPSLSSARTVAISLSVSLAGPVSVARVTISYYHLHTSDLHILPEVSEDRKKIITYLMPGSQMVSGWCVASPIDSVGGAHSRQHRGDDRCKTVVQQPNKMATVVRKPNIRGNSAGRNESLKIVDFESGRAGLFPDRSASVPTHTTMGVLAMLSRRDLCSVRHQTAKYNFEKPSLKLVVGAAVRAMWASSAGTHLYQPDKTKHSILTSTLEQMSYVRSWERARVVTVPRMLHGYKVGRSLPL
ncbi:hypothetical protein J6590_076440 [Homalodisca vitripennis]|nr:hypothetical protein J6590_076440 [Homalodisca vitripennis]